MDDIEALLRGARPASGHRDRALTARAERDLEALLSLEDTKPVASRRARLDATTHNRLHRRKRRVGAMLVAGVMAAAAVGLGGMLGGAPQEPRPVAQSAAPDPSTVLSAAAATLDASGGQSESGTVMPDDSDSQALAAWLTSGAATRADRAAWLEELSESGLATRAERGAGRTWRVHVADYILVIRADTGDIAAIIDAGGVEHSLPPAV